MLLPTEKNKSFRIALLGIYHESNTFVANHTTIQDFKKSRWLKGKAIINEYKDAHHELAGAIEVFTNGHVELLPVFYAETTPGGMITEEAYDEIIHEMMRELEKVLPVDACFVVPHGAGVAENHPDFDGSWLALLRKKTGHQIPIVGTLDPHANVSHQMANSTQGLFPYSTNPHIDQKETGKKAAQFLLDILHKKIQPLQHLLQVPLAISIEQQETAAEPCLSLFKLAKELCQTENVLHVNIALGFPYADVNEMGTAVIIITDNNAQKAPWVKEQLLSYFINHKEAFVGKKEDINNIITKIEKNPKPVLLLDMGDNVGGGSNGNSTYLMEELDRTALKYFISIYAPEAVAKCMDYKIQQTFALAFGNNPATEKQYSTTVILLSMHNGLFKEEEPRHGGQKHYDMGNTAIVITEKGNWVMLHSKRIPPFSLAQLTSCNIIPTDFDVIVAKGVVAPIAAYGPVCRTIVRVNSPGATQADMTKFNYQNRRRPLYPFEG
jgi:microcystin degradation protein MlrC